MSRISSVSFTYSNFLSNQGSFGSPFPFSQLANSGSIIEIPSAQEIRADFLRSGAGLFPGGNPLPAPSRP